MKTKWFASALLIAPVCGCTEDVEHLKAIGAKLANKTPQADKLGKMPWSDTASQLHSALSRDPIVHRVSYRLRFDKDLSEEKVTTELKGSGQIELNGFVSSENHRERAGEIASRTLGVEEVVNNLKVGKPESSPSGEKSPSEASSPETQNKETAKPENGPASAASRQPEKPAPASENKPSPQPGNIPVPGRPAGNSGGIPNGTPGTIPESPPVPSNTPASIPPALGAPVTIPPAPEKK